MAASCKRPLLDVGGSPGLVLQPFWFSGAVVFSGWASWRCTPCPALQSTTRCLLRLPRRTWRP
eukprot:12015015-Alexandrium_andersonii.AAC.1